MSDYTHLSRWERDQLAELKAAGRSVRAIARALGRAASTISRELRRNSLEGGAYTIVKDYVREHRRRSREMFVPLHHPPGHAQADFGEALVEIGGVEQKAHFFAIDLPHSDACYLAARSPSSAKSPGNPGDRMARNR